MGQIFNRLKRISSSYINESEEQILSETYAGEIQSDEKLKKIIDDLGKDKKRASDSSKEDANPNNPFYILNINETASFSEVKKAYFKIIKEYHPDKTTNLGKELRGLAEKKSKQINSAYEQIKKMRKR